MRFTLTTHKLYVCNCLWYSRMRVFVLAITSGVTRLRPGFNDINTISIVEFVSKHSLKCVHILLFALEQSCVLIKTPTYEHSVDQSIPGHY